MSNHSGERAAQRIRLAIIVAVLAALALASFWVLQVLRSNSDSALTTRPSSKPDYYVEQFSYVKMSETGQPRYDITGARMVHFPADDSFEVTKPVITTLTEEKAPMTLYSQRARIEDDNSKIHMYGDVNGNRAATAKSENMHLKTEYLLLLPDDDIAKTDKPVELTMGSSIMTGTGMIANNATQEFQLLHNVRGTYQPRPR
ncbi:LPS export ABC transporter periplasmic protein LptC [Herbaspirillum rhizosphaerae]|uniref:LPS export ABC transporter periplasmic protein LptC n=1 Tax=Herbaspirillum rhizosphaerae TaxID=346179 RepID=UPI00067CA109|nr:LPS export ABC transporter periplasmic protein LptC [Herbaspirillum rhizosphaerae]